MFWSTHLPASICRYKAITFLLHGEPLQVGLARHRAALGVLGALRPAHVQNLPPGTERAGEDIRQARLLMAEDLEREADLLSRVHQG
jgi:hypothetical protein